MTKRYQLTNDKAGFSGDGIDLCGDELDSVFPKACTNDHLTIVASTQRRHRKGEFVVHVTKEELCTPQVRVRNSNHQLFSETFYTLHRDFKGAEETLFVMLNFH